MPNTSYDVGFRPKSYAELRRMPQDQMVAIFDGLSPTSRGGVEFNDPNFWLAEIRRLDQEQINQSMLRLTRWVTFMTVIITALTFIMLLVTLRVI
jgi:hypothetical protein